MPDPDKAPEGPPEEPPSFHDAFVEDRRRAYLEFGATALLVTGTMMIAAGFLRPGAPGSKTGIVVGFLLVVGGLVLLVHAIRRGTEEVREGDVGDPD